MSENSQDFLNSITLLQTKLHRPHITNDLVIRIRLINHFEENKHKVLTLVSAPAGYGKSVAVSEWLEKTKARYVWVSLDEEHNEFTVFLYYLIAGIQLEYPSILNNVLALLENEEHPPLNKIGNLLFKEIEQIKDEFVIVLDDYHFIKEKTINEFLNYYFKHAPQNLHMVIISRIDPILKLQSLKAYNKISEVRMLELSFNEQEVSELLQKMFVVESDKKLLRILLEKTEGWIVGLRLALITTFQKGITAELLDNLKGDIFAISEFLVEEVLDQQSKGIKNLLLKTSLLDRFCADFVDELFCNHENEGDKITGTDFINELSKINLFTISLDDHNKWFRYHHLFQKLLQRKYDQSVSFEERCKLHIQISEWLEKNNLIPEAIDQRLKAKDTIGAAEIIERNRKAKQQEDEWNSLSKWLDKIPMELRHQRPELLLTEAWIRYEKTQVTQLITVIDKLTALYRNEEVAEDLIGEIYFFLGYFAYFSEEGEKCNQYFEKALEKIDGECGYMQGELELFLGLSRLMVGKRNEALTKLNLSLANANPKRTIYYTRLMGGIGFFHMFTGELTQAKLITDRMLYAAQVNDLDHTKNWSNYMLGWINFQTLNLEETVQKFTNLIQALFHNRTRVSVDVYAGLALSYQLLNNTHETSKTLQELRKYVIDFEDEECHLVSYSLNARLQLLQGDVDKALNWANTYNEVPNFSKLFLWLEAPPITQVRIWVAKGDEKSLSKAEVLLKKLEAIASDFNIDCHLIDVFILQSVFYDKTDNRKQALFYLEKAVKLAENNNWTRPFVEAGNSIISLLTSMQKNNRSLYFVSELIQLIMSRSFGLKKEASLTSKITTNNIKVVAEANKNAISLREKDVIELIISGMKNKEIGAKLYISENTVKKHISNIFQKLNVKNRVALIEKVRQLDFISENENFSTSY